MSPKQNFYRLYRMFRQHRNGDGRIILDSAHRLVDRLGTPCVTPIVRDVAWIILIREGAV